jgi:hypothetical protein
MTRHSLRERVLIRLQIEDTEAPAKLTARSKMLPPGS